MLIHVLYHGVQSVSPSLVVVEFQRANIDVGDGTSCSGETLLRTMKSIRLNGYRLQHDCCLKMNLVESRKPRDGYSKLLIVIKDKCE